MQPEAEYVCDSCGESICVPIDLAQGSRQQYVEDCPVCCHPNLIDVEVDAAGDVHASARSEQDLH